MELPGRGTNTNHQRLHIGAPARCASHCACAHNNVPYYQGSASSPSEYCTSRSVLTEFAHLKYVLVDLDDPLRFLFVIPPPFWLMHTYVLSTKLKHVRSKFRCTRRQSVVLYSSRDEAFGVLTVAPAINVQLFKGIRKNLHEKHQHIFNRYISCTDPAQLRHIK